MCDDDDVDLIKNKCVCQFDVTKKVKTPLKMANKNAETLRSYS